MAAYDECPYCGWDAGDGGRYDYCPECSAPLTPEADREVVLQDILEAVQDLPEHLTFREALPMVIEMVELDRPGEYLSLVAGAVRRKVAPGGVTVDESTEHGDNLLVSNFDRYATEGNEFIAVVYITERDRYTAIPGGYHERVIVQGDRDALRQAVREAFDYARRAGILRVQVNNPHVLDDLEAGILDAAGLDIVPGDRTR